MTLAVNYTAPIVLTLAEDSVDGVIAYDVTSGEAALYQAEFVNCVAIASLEDALAEAAEAAAAPADEAVEEPAAETTEAPAEEATETADAETAEATTTDATEAPAAEATEEPAAEATEEPAAEPTMMLLTIAKMLNMNCCG